MTRLIPLEPDFPESDDVHITVSGAGLDEACTRMGFLFARSESRVRAADYVRGLLSGIARKNTWQVAAHAGHANPDGIQWLLTRAPWSAAALRDVTRSYVMEQLGDDRAVLAFDDLAFAKRGDKSVGVARQLAGSAMRVENCQVGVFMAYVSTEGAALIDRELYLPRPEWSEDPVRRAAAGVPEHVWYASRSQLAARMLDRAAAANVPFGSVVVRQSCAGARLRESCHARRLTLVEEISPRWLVMDTRTGRRVEAGALARLIPRGAFEIGYPGGGAAAAVRLGRPVDGMQTSLLVRAPADPDGEYLHFVCQAPTWATLGNFVVAADTLAVTEQYISRSRMEVGLDQYEVRKWEPWYRHVTLSMFAMAHLAVTRARGMRADHLEQVDGIPRPRRERTVRPAGDPPGGR